MKTESNSRPSARFEIEALPPKEGAACTVILYDDIRGPFERTSGTDGTETETYYEYDRYEVPSTYRFGLAQSVEESFDIWLQNAKDAENETEKPTELEALQNEVERLRKENKEMSDTIDDLIIASLGGDDFV